MVYIEQFSVTGVEDNKDASYYIYSELLQNARNTWSDSLPAIMHCNVHLP